MSSTSSTIDAGKDLRFILFMSFADSCIATNPCLRLGSINCPAQEEHT